MQSRAACKMRGSLVPPSGESTSPSLGSTGDRRTPAQQVRSPRAAPSNRRTGVVASLTRQRSSQREGALISSYKGAGAHWPTPVVGPGPDDKRDGLFLKLDACTKGASTTPTRRANPNSGSPLAAAIPAACRSPRPRKRATAATGWQAKPATYQRPRRPILKHRREEG